MTSPIHVLYTAGPDERTIVKSVGLANNSAGSRGIYIAVFDGVAVYSVLRVAALASADVAYFDCWVVLNEGDQLLGVVTGADVACLVSGAELLAP